MTSNDTYVLELLEQHGVVTSDQIAECRSGLNGDGSSLVDALLQNGVIEESEILATIADREIDVVFPLEYRYVKGDDLWLSMDEGGDRAAISVHRRAQNDYRPLFDAVEPIFWKYGGRPHWGKVHSLGYAELSALYPKFDEFIALRAELDPEGRLLNDHLRTLFGV
jgi:FAD/FMN-containing dehydrogenase